MKFLMYSEAGEGAQILKRIEAEGNEVGLYINDPIYKSVWNGLIPKVKPSFADAETIIIFDLSGNGDVADEFRKSGHLVYGASKFADKLEQDRKFGFDVMKKGGIQTPATKEFTDFRQGIDFVRGSNDRLVFKPSGSMPCKLTYVSKDSDELIAYMQFVERKFGSKVDSFVLQEYIEGVVVSTELFVSKGKIVWPPNHTVEVKKSMNDELGPSTGCAGNIVWPIQTDCLVEALLGIEDTLKAENYTGQIDLNAVLTDECEVYGLEWTPRFGYDATPTLFPLVSGELGKLFSDLARGQVSEINLSDGYAAGVRVSIPPYPAEPLTGIDPEKFSPSIGIPIQNWEVVQGSCYFYEVMREGDQLVHSGGTGVILCAVGVANTPEGSLEQPYEIAAEINIPDKQYRTDLYGVLPKMINEVNEYAE